MRSRITQFIHFGLAVEPLLILADDKLNPPNVGSANYRFLCLGQPHCLNKTSCLSV